MRIQIGGRNEREEMIHEAKMAAAGALGVAAATAVVSIVTALVNAAVGKATEKKEAKA